MTIKLFIDYMSQPSRAVLVLCLMNKIPYQVVETRLGQMQNRTPQFSKINPAQKVPAIFDTDNNLALAESHAIMRYLCTKFKIPQNWYPSQDLARRAKIDQYLDYHHTNTRNTAFYIFNKVIKGSFGLPVGNFNEEKAINNYEKVYDFIQENYLKETDYLVGNKISIADLSAYEEIQSLYLTNTSLEKWPKLNKWMKKLSQIPEVAQVDKIYYKVADKIKQKFLKPKL